METQDIKTQTLKTSLGDAACYIGNVAELAEEVGDVLVEDGDGKIILDFDGGIKLLQVVWDKVKETVFECAGGQELQIKLREGILGGIIAAALSLVGFRL